MAVFCVLSLVVMCSLLWYMVLFCCTCIVLSPVQYYRCGGGWWHTCCVVECLYVSSLSLQRVLCYDFLCLEYLCLFLCLCIFIILSVSLSIFKTDVIHRDFMLVSFVGDTRKCLNLGLLKCLAFHVLKASFCPSFIHMRVKLAWLH